LSCVPVRNFLIAGGLYSVTALRKMSMTSSRWPQTLARWLFFDCWWALWVAVDFDTYILFIDTYCLLEFVRCDWGSTSSPTAPPSPRDPTRQLPRRSHWSLELRGPSSIEAGLGHVHRVLEMLRLRLVLALGLRGPWRSARAALGLERDTLLRIPPNTPKRPAQPMCCMTAPTGHRI
jgi:hypothetical protein